MGRYLIHFQYFGTKYCGVVRACKQTIESSGMVGVQDVIENSLAKLNPYRPPKIFVSSRTDAGVHALCNTAHFDLERPPGKPVYFRRESLRLGLNSYISRDDPVRVIDAQRVPDNFHSQRRAVSRSYLYRIAVGCGPGSLPITETGRCWAVKEHLDVDAMREATQVFLGTHDFSAFKSCSSDDLFKSPVKTVDSIELAYPQLAHLDHHLCHRNSAAGDLRFLEVVFRSRSFLYKQIRRMMSALVAVGRGRLSAQDLQDALKSRDNTHPHSSITAPANGLYLREVLYNDQDLQVEDTDLCESLRSRHEHTKS